MYNIPTRQAVTYNNNNSNNNTMMIMTTVLSLLWVGTTVQSFPIVNNNNNHHHQHQQHHYYNNPHCPEERRTVPGLEAVPDKDQLSDMILSNNDNNNNNPDSILSSAFSSLNERDQYDAVLTGLCANILDGKVDDSNDDDDSNKENDSSGSISSSSSSTTTDVLSGPMSLLQEMNTRGVPASPRSLSALIDVATKAESALSMSSVMSLSVRNRGGGVGVRRYGTEQPLVRPFTTTTTATATTSSTLPPVPTDQRTTELLSAVTFTLVTMGALVGSNQVGSGPLLLSSLSSDSSSSTPLFSSLILYALGAAVIVDNGYDALTNLQKMAQFAWQQQQQRSTSGTSTSTTSTLPNLLPPKDELPLGLGRGDVTKVVLAGYARLFTADLERECQCEAAAFLAAYTLGLPCFAFRPNSLEAVVLLVESTNTTTTTTTTLDPLLSTPGVLKILIWLLAPVAVEDAKHAQLLVSDPREAAGFLRRLAQTCRERGGGGELEYPFEDNENDDILLRWAWREAQQLLRRNQPRLEELTKRLVGGAATVGDCVAVLEEW